MQESNRTKGDIWERLKARVYKDEDGYAHLRYDPDHPLAKEEREVWDEHTDYDGIIDASPEFMTESWEDVLDGISDERCKEIRERLMKDAVMMDDGTKMIPRSYCDLTLEEEAVFETDEAFVGWTVAPPPMDVSRKLSAKKKRAIIYFIESHGCMNPDTGKYTVRDADIDYALGDWYYDAKGFVFGVLAQRGYDLDYGNGQIKHFDKGLFKEQYQRLFEEE